MIFNNLVNELIIETTEKGAKCGSYDIVQNPNSAKLNTTEKIVIVDNKRIDIEGVMKEDLQLDIDMMSS